MACCDKCANDLATRSTVHFAWASGEACGGCSSHWARLIRVEVLDAWLHEETGVRENQRSQPGGSCPCRNS